MQSSFTIYHLAEFENKLEQLNRKFARYGVRPIAIVYCEKQTELQYRTIQTPMGNFDSKQLVTFYDVKIDYDVLKLGDYSLIAAINHKENIVNLAPNVDSLPKQFIGCAPNCDHCEKNIVRNDTFIIQSETTKDYKQVGRNCLAVFIEVDASNILQMTDAYAEISALRDEIADSPMRKSGDYDLLPYLACAKYCIDNYGWHSSTDTRPTKNDALDVLTTQSEYKKVSEDDFKFSQLTIDYMLTLEHSDDNYQRNLFNIAANGYTTRQSYGYAASAVNAYCKQLQTDLSKPVSSSQFQGKVKQRLTLENLTVIFTLPLESMYGTSRLHLLEDKKGNVYKWVSTSEFFNQGEIVSGKGTVKEHTVYQSKSANFPDVNQTVITRCKFEIVDTEENV